jgi:hypothetical protein
MDESVFSLFASRARRRSTRSFTVQCAACVLAAALIMIELPLWWPVAAAIAAGACYAGWGLVDRRQRSRVGALATKALAIGTTLLTIVAAAGLALAAFTGDGRSPYGTCYDANGRAFACDAKGQRR